MSLLGVLIVDSLLKTSACDIIDVTEQLTRRLDAFHFILLLLVHYELLLLLCGHGWNERRCRPLNTNTAGGSLRRDKKRTYD